MRTKAEHSYSREQGSEAKGGVMLSLLKLKFKLKFVACM
jgi:hypothetical protein